MASQPRGRAQRRAVRRLTPRSVRTEVASLGWGNRFRLLQANRPPKARGAAESRACLASLAPPAPGAAATPQGALHALRLLSRAVLAHPFPPLDEIARAKRPRRLPPVCPREAGHAIRARRAGRPPRMARRRDGAGLRLREGGRLRVPAVAFPSSQRTGRDGPGAPDRGPLRPRSLAAPGQRPLARVQRLHADALRAGYGAVSLPYAWARQAPHAGTAWGWQSGCPAAKRASDPRSGGERRPHGAAAGRQRAVQAAIQRAGIPKPGRGHTRRHRFATPLLEDGSAIRTV